MTNKITKARKATTVVVVRTTYHFINPTSPGVTINIYHDAVHAQPEMHEDMNWTGVYRMLIQNGWRASKETYGVDIKEMSR